MSSPLLTREEVAAFLKISTRQLDRLPLAKLRIGRSVRFLLADLEAYLASMRMEPNTSSRSASIMTAPKAKPTSRAHSQSTREWKQQMMALT